MNWPYCFPWSGSDSSTADIKRLKYLSSTTSTTYFIDAFWINWRQRVYVVGSQAWYHCFKRNQG